jgi:phospholipid/cholesterol/gamma-HCH transport system permease protein
MTGRAARMGRVCALPVVDALAGLGHQATFWIEAVAAVPRALVAYGRHVLRLVAEVSFGSASLLAGGGAVGVVFAMSFVSSTQVGLEGYRSLNLVGLSPMTGLMSAVINTREIAPLVASVALAAQMGTRFTAELGTMRVSEEIDALEAMAVPSVPFLVSTRIAAAFIAVIPLYLVGLFASFLATRLAVVFIDGQSAGNYDYWFHLVLTPGDVLDSLAKAVGFALIVTLVHCYYGFYAQGGPEGVGRAAGRALRTSIVSITIADMLASFLFWGVHPSLPGLGVGG